MRKDLLEDIRQRKGLDKHDTSKDAEIKSVSPETRLRALCGWHLGDAMWADTFLEWARECGFTVTEDQS